MITFIWLTRRDVAEDVYCNPSHISRIIPVKSGSQVRFDDGSIEIVIEDPSTILERIGEVS